MKASGGDDESQRPEHGSTPHAQAWADESSDGLSSDSDVEPVQHDERSKQPMHGTAGFRRMRSWQEPAPEVQRALNSLTSFRSALVANQKKMLQLLDDELDRIKGVSGVGQGLGKEFGCTLPLLNGAEDPPRYCSLLQQVVQACKPHTSGLSLRDTAKQSKHIRGLSFSGTVQGIREFRDLSASFSTAKV